MADLGPAVGALFEVLSPLLGPMAKRALSAFVRTTFGMVALGLGAAFVAWTLAGRAVWWHGALAAAGALALFGGVGVYLAAQRAVGAAVMLALGRLELGRKLLGLVFGQLLGVREAEPHAERGRAVARAAERLPLRQAEALLSDAVARLVAADDGARGARAWLRRRVSQVLLARIELLTLARFRDADAKAGGVDLVAVRDELSERVDLAVAAEVARMMARLTALATFGAAFGSVLWALALRRWLGGQ